MVIALLLSSTPVMAQSLDHVAPGDDEIVAERDGIVVTVRDLKAKVRSQVPPEARHGYFLDGQKVAGLVETTLLTGQVVRDAEAQGLDRDPKMVEELEQVRQDVLARNQVEHYIHSRPLPDFKVLAREMYRANKARHIQPREIDVRHVLISTDDRSEREALELAEQVRAMAVGGEDFGKLVDEYSKRGPGEDGWLRGFTPESYDPGFAAGVTALTNVGDISEPVRSAYGYHIIKLEAVRPERQLSFEQVEPMLLSEVKEKFLADTRRDYLNKFSNQSVKLHDDVISRLRLIDNP